MNWTEVNFGKHSGLTLPQIMFKDPDWFFYGFEKGYFKKDHSHEAQELYRRARALKVPIKNGQPMLVEYVIHSNGKFGTMRLIADGPDLEPLHVSPRIDFYMPRQYAQYDKTGYNNFVHALKSILFDNPSHRMTKQACEDFFNSDDNFDLN